MQGSVRTQKRSKGRRRCVQCGEPAIFKVNGHLRGDKQHELCARCWDKACRRGKNVARAVLGIPVINSALSDPETLSLLEVHHNGDQGPAAGHF